MGRTRPLSYLIGGIRNVSHAVEVPAEPGFGECSMPSASYRL